MAHAALPKEHEPGECRRDARTTGSWRVTVRPAAAIKDLVIEIADGARWGTVTVTGAAHELQRRPERWRVVLPELVAGAVVHLTLTPP
ncbi:MAG: hypothetical protein M5U12_18055 [Verrucomicrobia bacterium]|nr:hypothetical protein [Verrucomicrobiota bacterium]